MALTQEQVTLISVAAFGVKPGEEHSQYFLDSDAAGKFLTSDGDTDKQIHEVLGLKEPLTGTAAVAAVLAHEYNYLVVTKGLEEVSDAAFVKNTAKNLGAELGAENSKTLAIDLASGMPRYEALVKFAEAEAEKAGGIEKVAGFITAQESDKTIDNAVKALVDSAVKPDDTPNKPEVDGETYVLTEGRDTTKDFTGTADKDLFIADAGQNSLGMITNALSTGDRLDGGAGTDTLEVTLVADESFNTTMAVRPVTDSIENVFINALAQGYAFANNSTDVTSKTRLNADQMSDLEQIWSNGSEGSLRVENVKNPGETADLIIGMRSTGNAGSIADRSESNYEVYFQEQELTAGSTGEGSFFYDILNQAAWNQDSTTPVKGFPLDSLRFDISFGGAKAVEFRVQLEDGDMKDINTHAQLVSLLNDKLAVMQANDARLDGLDFVVKGTFNDGDGRNNIDQIRLVDSKAEGRELVGGTTKLDEEAPSGNLYWNQGAQGTQISNEPITANVILDDVGRTSDGGFLRVGSMSDSLGKPHSGSTGIEVYDLEVQRDSSLSGLYTTNGTLDKILIKSATGSDGDLTIGNSKTAKNGVSAQFNEALKKEFNEGVSEAGLTSITTSGFNGNLSLGTLGDRFVNTGRLDAVIEGNVTFNALVNDANNDSTVYSYNTGSGADTVDVNLNTDTIDRVDTGLTINTGAGADTIRLNSKVLANELDASQLTMAKLDNVKVNAGSGDDFVQLVGDVRANINAGAGSDFVVINSDGEAKDIYGGSWNFGSASVSQGAGFGPQVLYNAQLTVTFAGFESTVKVPTDAAGNFVANQLVINQAIRNAIAESPELARLLKVTNKDGSQQITVDSTVAGANALTVEINQPNAVVANAVTGEVQISTGDLLALQKGLIATTAGDSDTFNSIDAVATAIGGTRTVLENTVKGLTSTTESNFSVINMGGGVSDLLVLDSNRESSNIIKIDEGFGKVSVVNFHNQNDNTGSIATNTVGNHAIDFTSILDNTADRSANDNNLSEQDVAITLNTTGGSAGANSVNMLKFTQSTADNAVEWKNLTAQNLVDVLNGVTDTAPVGSLTASSLSATATPNLLQTTQKHIVMLENQDNLGEYKVFKLTSTIEEDRTVKDSAFSGAELLGTLDFGASINFNLVGSTAFKGIYDELLHKADDSVYVPTEAPSEEPTEEPVDPDANLVAIDVVPVNSEFTGSFAGTEAKDIFTVSGVEADLVNLVAQISITEFGANDSLDFSGVYANGFVDNIGLGLGQPIDISMDGTNLQVTLMDVPGLNDIDTWIVTFEAVDANIAAVVNGAADTQAALAGLNDAWNAEWLVLA